MKIFYYSCSKKAILEDDSENNDSDDDDIIIPIKIGQTANENTQLIKDGVQYDYWFHLDGFPSPHGIVYLSESNLKNPSKFDMSKEKALLQIVANLVRENSKYKKQSLKVNYCPIKNLSHGDKPGLVILKKKPKTITI